MNGRRFWRCIMYPKIDEPQRYAAALYLRLSKDDETKDEYSESIKNQKSLLEGYAEKEHLNIFDVYIDDGYSGTSTKRPDLQRMIEDISNKKVNMVITKDLSRLSRNHIDTGYFLESFFPEKNVRYIALTDGYDTEIDGYTSELAMFKGMFNDMYARDISRKITSVKRDKQKKGLFIGGKAPYGYKKSPTDKNYLIIDEETADNVRYIFQLALDGKSCRQIAMTLNAENIPTPALYANIKPSEKQGAFSGLWSSERISDMLQNEVYIGNMVQGRVQKLSHKSDSCHKLPKEKWTIVENTHEPIIDKETFEKVGLLIKSRVKTRSRKYDYLLKGLVYCNECGSLLGVMNRKLASGEMLYFICRTYQRFTAYQKCTCHCIRVEDVTNAVIEQVRNVCQQFLNRLDMAEINDETQKFLQAEKKRQEKDAADLKSKLKAVESKIDKIYDDKLSDNISNEMFQRFYQKFSDEQSVLREKIRELENSDEKEIELSLEKVRELVIQFLNAEEYSKELLVSLIERIELTEKKEVLIYFRFKELEAPDHL